MKFNFFVPKKYKEFVKTCHNYFQLGETGIYLFLPMTDRERRIEQLIQDHQTDIRFVSLQLNTLMVDTVDNVSSFIKQQFPKGPDEILGIFVVRSEIAVTERSIDFLDKLIDFSEKDTTYRFLFVSEMDFTSPDIAKLFSSRT